MVSAVFHSPLGVAAVMNPASQAHLPAPHCRYVVECFGPDGELKWREDIGNLVVTVGKNSLLDTYFAGSAYTAAWYMGLKGTGTAASTDTLASHGGWSELNPYSGNRPAISWSAASGGSKSATAVSYSITSTATVAGAFICTAASGTSGTLYSAGDFAASRGVANGDTLNVTPTMSV